VLLAGPSLERDEDAAICLIQCILLNPFVTLNHWIRSPRTRLSCRVVSPSALSLSSYFIFLRDLTDLVARL
jgi:hypothetical protein